MTEQQEYEMSEDLTEELRAIAKDTAQRQMWSVKPEKIEEAADEIERLRAALTKIRDTAPDYHTERFVDRVLRGVELTNGDDR